MSRASRSRALLRVYGPSIFLFVACTWVVFTMWRDESYSRLEMLDRTTEIQKKQNAQTDRQVAQLRNRIRELQEGGRELEKTARNELGLARPGELVFFFEESKAEVTGGDDAKP